MSRRSRSTSSPCSSSTASSMRATPSQFPGSVKLMPMTTEELERHLLNDLQTLGDLVGDDSFFPELYRGLAGTRWFLDDDGGHLSLSWKRAEEVVNSLRSEHGREPLTLAQTGGEGEVSDRVGGALGQLGGPPPPPVPAHDDAHVEAEPERQGGGGAEPPEWRRQADAEAEENRS